MADFHFLFSHQDRNMECTKNDEGGEIRNAENGDEKKQDQHPGTKRNNGKTPATT